MDNTTLSKSTVTFLNKVTKLTPKNFFALIRAVGISPIASAATGEKDVSQSNQLYKTGEQLIVELVEKFEEMNRFERRKMTKALDKVLKIQAQEVEKENN